MGKSMIKKIIICILFTQSVLFAVVMQEGAFVKEQMELEKLKKELDVFYKQKDSEYKKQLEELQKLDNQIKTNLQTIEDTKKDNQKIMDEIDLKVQSKAMKLYGKMKVKIVYSILQEKIDNGNLNDVFDIIIRLKEKRVMKLMKLFDTQTATELMNMMSEHKQNQEEK